MNRQSIRKIVESVVRKALNESFEDYEQGYEGSEFNPDMSPKELADWCKHTGDFLYAYEGLRGLRIMSATTENVKASIINDLYNCNDIVPTHEIDNLLSSRPQEFDNSYICVYKTVGVEDGDYYIIYQEDK
jgi:hypothetical protein